jgi:hypothetical protein
MSKLCASTLRCAFSICLVTSGCSIDVALLHSQALHQRGHPSEAKMRIRLSSKRQVEAAGARVALAAGAAAQLVVDAAGLVALGADDVQAAGLQHRVVAQLPFALRTLLLRIAQRRAERVQLGFQRTAEHDVGAAAGHVGGDGHRARRPAWATMCASRSCCLAFSTSCGMPSFFSMRQQLAGLDRGGADQHRLAAWPAHSRMSSMIARELVLAR